MHDTFRKKELGTNKLPTPSVENRGTGVEKGVGEYSTKVLLQKRKKLWKARYF